MTTKERPIIFSGPMVRAILEGRKTQTRRVVKQVHCPYGKPGHRLWVREAWGLFNDLGFCDTSLARLQTLPYPWQLAYRADHVDPVRGDGPHRPYWRPSIHMPRWASRITLEITGIRVERLQEISEVDARAEGIADEAADKVLQMAEAMNQREPSPYASAFETLWQSIHGPDSWDVNPWVWVVEFQRQGMTA